MGEHSPDGKSGVSVGMKLLEWQQAAPQCLRASCGGLGGVTVRVRASWLLGSQQGRRTGESKALAGLRYVSWGSKGRGSGPPAR